MTDRIAPHILDITPLKALPALGAILKLRYQQLEV